MSKFTILTLCLVTLFLCTKSFSDQNDGVSSFESPLLVKKDQRTPIVATEFGEISAVQIGDGYHIQFITLEPNALLLPLLLHSDMVFFVHTGSGILNWVDEEKERTLQLRRGDVFRLRSGSVFYVHSNLERDQIQEKLSVYAIFDVGKCLHDPCLGAYSNIRDLLLGFDEITLRSAFAVPEEVFGKLRDASKPPLITNALPRDRTQGLEEETWTSRLAKLFVGVEDVTDHLEMKPVVNSKKKKKSTAYNVFEADPDFENVNGQSIVVDEKDMDALKGSSVGVYMVNLTKGSILGPHWNPNACEISIVLRGEGMIRVVNQPSSQCKSKSKSESERFMVEEGDVFVVPQFHPMAQMSFVNSSFMFMGFSTSAKTNHPQFLVAQSSVLKVYDRDVLATSFNVRSETIERLLGAQKEAVMLECVSCAEVELSRLMREIEERKRREEEEIERRRKEEEEARKKEEERKEEEEAAKRQEEERRRREEEEAERRRKEEEEARTREEERKREEEAAMRREEERRRREEEETERKRKEEEARKREEERKKEEEAAKRREEERRKREEEEEEARKREEAREREEEKAKRQEEERKRREKEEEEARKREEEREREEEEAKRREDERMRREKEKEAARKREEERKKEEEMAKRREEERQRKEREEAETKRREEQERKRREEEAVRREREEERKREEEAAKRAEEERRRREEEERRPPPQPQGQQRPIDH